MDLIQGDDFNALRERFESLGFPLYTISGVTGEGLEPLMDGMLTTLRENTPEEPIEILVPTLKANDDLSWEVNPTEEGYHVVGRRLERMVAMTDLGNDEAVRYLHRRLQRIGVIDRLRELGAEEGDTVAVGDVEFAFSDER